VKEHGILPTFTLSILVDYRRAGYALGAREVDLEPKSPRTKLPPAAIARLPLHVSPAQNGADQNLIISILISVTFGPIPPGALTKCHAVYCSA
jgi:hypothetical protein